MDRRAWWATVMGLQRMGYDWATNTIPSLKMKKWGLKGLSEVMSGKFRNSTQLHFLQNAFPRQSIRLLNSLHASLLSTSSVQSLSHLQLFATPWTAAHQVSLSITNSQSLLKLLSMESGMPSNHLILCHPLLLPPSISPSICAGKSGGKEQSLCCRMRSSIGGAEGNGRSPVLTIRGYTVECDSLQQQSPTILAPVSWNTIFPQIGEGEDDLGEIQQHYI